MTTVRNDPLYGRWNAIKQRCDNPSNPKYHLYGGKGISLHEDWRNFHSFKDWSLSNGYKRHLTIDRIDNNGNYEPSNCRWVNQKVQQNNRSNNRIINYKDKEYTLAQLSEISGVHPETILLRLSKGLSVEEALVTKVSFRKICIDKGLPYKTIYARVNRGWDVQEAINTPIKKGNYKRNV